MKAPHQDSVGVRRSYDLTVPPIVRFGSGRIAEVGSIATVLGKPILVSCWEAQFRYMWWKREPA